MSLATGRHTDASATGTFSAFELQSPGVTRDPPDHLPPSKSENARLTLAVSQVLQGLLVTQCDSSRLDDQGELGVDRGRLLGGLGLSGGGRGHFCKVTVSVGGVRPVTKKALEDLLVRGKMERW
jgi:hypothetical protein